MTKWDILKLYLLKFISLFVGMFTVYILGYCFLTGIVFAYYQLPLNYVMYLVIISAVVALIMIGIYKIKTITPVVQAIIIYVVVTTSVYVIGFLTKCFVMNSKFWIATIIINLVGIIFVLLFIIIRGNINNKDLNAKLKDYKEREK